MVQGTTRRTALLSFVGSGLAGGAAFLVIEVLLLPLTRHVQWDGPRPSPSGYYPKQLQGAIILGTGGDGSNGGTGTFFEGAMTTGSPADATDDQIQSNIVAAGYGQ